MRRIGTHSGSFHCDEALAVFMLKLLPEWNNAIVTRSRDPATLAACDILVDVGGVYDPATLRFDHHQRGFEEHFPGFANTKLSSAGLVYHHFGARSLEACLGAGVDVSRIYRRVYESFVEGVDAIDNGVAQYEGGRRVYRNATDLGARVARLNPAWNEPAVDDAALDARFARAVQLTGEEFAHFAREAAFSWLPARDIVKRCMAARRTVDPSGAIVVLDQFCPWTDHLFDLEREEDVPGQVKYVLFADGATWRVRAVPVEGESFANRLGLPEPWRGMRDDALDQEAGIAGCVFVHASGFIGGNKTLEGALAMARKALAFEEATKRQKTAD